MENTQLFRKIFKKYLDNSCSKEEIDYLFGQMQSEQYRHLANELIESRLKDNQQSNEIHDDDLKERLDARLHAILSASSEQLVIPKRRMPVWKWVAAAAILPMIFVGLYRYSMQKTPEQAGPSVSRPMAATSLTGYTRYINLPDGSSVVLHAGSKLEYPTVFAGKTREVRLSGEAYFDVAHIPEKPFIIHTANVKTTVLGTAFNIKADENKVVISVTRGKVKVEDETKVLAVLIPNEQVEYNIEEAEGVTYQVDAKTIVTDWTRESMIFNGITFEEIGKILSRRYGVPVQFENEALKRCKIRASFSGTEGLDQVASVLSAVRNGSFKQNTDGTIVFAGEGCD